jgi:predicted Zn-dependent peptidase
MNLFTLPNGLRFVHRYRPSPVVYCGLSIDVGSRDEAPAENGMAHLAEHMLFKGTRRRSAYHINNRLETVGGELNAFTTKEETVVHAIVLKHDFEKAVELIADMVFRSTFADKELAKEKEVIADEINSYRDNPAELIFDDFDRRLFADSPMGMPILGTAESLAGIRSPELKAFVERHYAPAQMVFSSIGRISARRMEQLAYKYFSPFPATPSGTRRTAPPTATAPFRKEQRHRTFQAHCLIGARAYSLNDPRRTGLALLVNYLGGPAANSRLNTLLREKNGLVYTVEAAYTPYLDCGAATVYFGADKERVAQCEELVYRELYELCTQLLTPTQLHRIKKQLLGQLSIQADHTEAQMLSQAKSLMAYGEVETFEQMQARIDALTAPQLRDIANEILLPENVSTLIYH